MSQLATKKKKKLTVGDVSFNIVNYLVFGIFTLICIYPFYYIHGDQYNQCQRLERGRRNQLPAKGNSFFQL